MDKIVEDDELGRLIVRVNSRARSLVFRTKSDAVYVSVPPGTTLKEVKQAIENLRGKLLASRQKLARPLIDLGYKIDAEHFKLSLVSGEKDQFIHSSTSKGVIVSNLNENYYTKHWISGGRIR